ncbi:SprT-like domain-containing protein [Lutibacter sp. A80]|uniref:SprT-like domain-containing protein n=1 Tax=Lutibacter sp. A80 TaxID=2918453 RepID=UPI001F05B2EF|nr:SprT-like domain-containing protein [Lutibacter sp. A80]UMB61803.1 SprT-like domain-containing protein [Lutibacter sp. A80]
MIQKLSKYIPENALILVQEILEEHPLVIKIVKERATKHGDFKRTIDSKVEITINNNLNQYHFLITLIHELAHFVTFKKYKRIKPHGIEWKRNFQHLMLPFLNPEIFPEDLLPLLANYLINPKASTGSDVNLMQALNKYDDNSGKSFIFELPHGSMFLFKNKIYKKGNIRRTRYECVEMKSKKTYLFNKNAAVEIIEHNE